MSDLTGFSTIGTPRPPLKPWGFGTGQTQSTQSCPDPLPLNASNFQGSAGLGLMLFPGQMQASLLAIAEAQLLNLCALQTLLREKLNLPDELAMALRQLTRCPEATPETELAHALTTLLNDLTLGDPLHLEPLKTQWIQQLDKLTSQLFSVMAHSGLSAGAGQGHPQQDLMEFMAHFHTLLAEKPTNALTLLWALYLPPIVLQPPYDFRFQPQPGSGEGEGAGGGSTQEELTLYITTLNLGQLTITVGLGDAAASNVIAQLRHDPVVTDSLRQTIEQACRQSHLPAMLNSRLDWIWLPKSGRSVSANSLDSAQSVTSREDSAQVQLAPAAGKVSPVLVLAAFAISAAIVAVDQSTELTSLRARRQEDIMDPPSTLQ